MPVRRAQPRGDLGCFATFTHPDDFKDGSAVVQAAIKARVDRKDGLQEFIKVFPDTRSATHNFQSACRSVQSARGTNRVEVEVDEVLNDGSECIYQITRRVRDKAEKVIEHEKSMTLALNKGTGTIEVRQLDDYDALRGLEDRVRAHFRKNAKAVPGQKIRNAIRDVILAVGGQNVRGKAGGLYFVPEEYRSLETNRMRKTMPVLDALAELIDELYGDRGDFFVIDAPATDYMRKIVAKHFTINAKQESEKVLEKALNRLRAGAKTRGLREDFTGGILNEYRRLAGALDQFDEMVGVERKEIESNLRDIDKALVDLEALRGKTG